jgi:hypothetical protein
MLKGKARPFSGAAVSTAITQSVQRPAIYAEQPIPTTAAKRQRVAVDVEPFWKLATSSLPAGAGDSVIEPMVSLDGDGRPLVELRAYDAEMLGKRLILAARAALEG